MIKRVHGGRRRQDRIRPIRTPKKRWPIRPKKEKYLPKNLKHYLDLEKEAREKGLGIWEKRVSASPYLGQQPPGKTPEVFAPGIISTGATEGAASFSTDGLLYLFARARSSQEGIFIMEQINGVWSKPRLAPFSAGRHDWDFIHVLNFIYKDLPVKQIEEIISFFKCELMTENWMHALSPLDDDVYFSVRPDHQWNGSYPAWVAFAACALVETGRIDLLKKWLPGLARSANQGPYSQAHFVETYAETENGGARKAPTEWPFITDWAILAVGGFFELILLCLFGIDFGLKNINANPKIADFDKDARIENIQYQKFHPCILSL